MFMYGKAQERQPFQVCSRCPYSTNTQASTSRKPTLYDVLDVSEKATLGEIRDAFITKSKKLHPDMNPHKPELHTRFVQINNAYSVLSNVSHRHEYDLRLSQMPISKSSSSGASPFGSVPPRRQSSHSYYYERATSNSKYRQTRSYDFATPRPVENYAKKQKSNRLIVLGAVAFMLIGATVEYAFIRARHNKYKSHADESSRKANQLYVEVREKARSNGLKKQLELLVSQHSELERVAATKVLQRHFDNNEK
ncbi:DnaJ molecular chaperone y domain [Desmophyllum pertusum]|uniref:DnaJ molecular chaperone y domain n=1 Tax=Desmophyllum pertusum TaxID=174260 RepID=A0A9W9YJB4_9CNID|nr:DnaJ molecular chaperone y domain [Desmophyllum pertusum]